MSKDSPLQNLFIKSSEEAEKILYEVLKDYIRIDKETHEIIFLENYQSLSNEKKILLTLLARKALQILNLVEDDSLTPREISNKTGVNYNTVRPTLASLTKRGLVNRKEKGKYYIEITKLRTISKIIKGDKSEK